MSNVRMHDLRESFTQNRKKTRIFHSLFLKFHFRREKLRSSYDCVVLFNQFQYDENSISVKINCPR